MRRECSKIFRGEFYQISKEEEGNNKIEKLEKKGKVKE